VQLLGESAPDSVAALAHRYEEAAKDALLGWTSADVPGTPGGEAQVAFLDWLLSRGLLGPAATGPLAGLLAQYRLLESGIPVPQEVLAMAEGDGVDEHVFVRGNHKTPGELAPRQFLVALSKSNPAPFKQGSGRLELARCLTDPSNPLLARVMVNRVWFHLFGRGIVPTPDDFGVLGQRPTHPELLDWLANWFRTEAGWSVKKLVRLLVTSSAYRMASNSADALAEEKDPDNSLFHRMPIKRLEGEAIRDAMLAVSGRLDETMFGPSVPTYLTAFMQGSGRPDRSGPLDGAGRRSIYLEVRRNFLSPMLRAFDMPVPFTTIGRRTVSNVPAQSLILMNDPFVLDQAQLWARRILARNDGAPEESIGRIYRTAFSRPPAAAEERQGLAFMQKQAEALGISAPQCWQDERVWTDFCHVVFNVKEFIFVE
jgi:hypothetical protein